MTDVDGVIEARSSVRTLDCRVLGLLDVRVGGAPAELGGRKQRSVLAVLIAAAGRPMSVDSLLIATYGEDVRPGAKATLHTYVSNLRKALGDVIVRQGDAYLLDCTGATIDAAVFEDLCTRATAIEDPERARRSVSLDHSAASGSGHSHRRGVDNTAQSAPKVRLRNTCSEAPPSRVEKSLTKIHF